MIGSSRLATTLLGTLAVLSIAGCFSSPEAPKNAAPPFAGVAVKVATIGDPALPAGIDHQRGEWEASTGATAEIGKSPVEPDKLGGAHLIVFPADRLGDMIDAKLLMKLPEALVQPPAPNADSASEQPPEEKDDEEETDALQFNDILPAYRDQVTKWGIDRYALPYGGSALVLVVNRAAFTGEAAKKAAEAAGIKLEPPKTWDELDALAKFFQGRDWNGDGTPDYGTSLPLGPDPEGVGVAVYLARAASLGQHRDHYALLFDADTMEPRLTTPPFVEALEKLVNLKACAPPESATFDADKAREAFRKGNAAFLIDRAERSSKWGSAEGAKAVGVVPLPGSERVYEPSRKVWETASGSSLNKPSYLPFGGGWLVGVSAKAEGTEREAALDLAKYLASAETSNRVRSDRGFPMLPARSSQVGSGLPDPRSSPGVEPRTWSDAVGRTLGSLKVVPGLRIPKAQGYLEDLDKGRTDAIRGKNAEAALKEVSEAWNKRTDALGRARQAWHYQRSLNSLVTSPEPPAAKP